MNQSTSRWPHCARCGAEPQWQPAQSGLRRPLRQSGQQQPDNGSQDGGGRDGRGADVCRGATPTAGRRAGVGAARAADGSHGRGVVPHEG